MVKQYFTIDGVLAVPPAGVAVPMGSGPDTIHYSFDFAQQVHYPPIRYSQDQSMYFKTARKCAVFGVCCEGVPRQVNYLIDEASDVGKGANTVISLLHHFLEHHGLGEINIGLHADNCVGQNKNNAVLQVRKTNTTIHVHVHVQIQTINPSCIYLSGSYMKLGYLFP